MSIIQSNAPLTAVAPITLTQQVKTIIASAEFPTKIHELKLDLFDTSGNFSAGKFDKNKKLCSVNIRKLNPLFDQLGLLFSNSGGHVYKDHYEWHDKNCNNFRTSAERAISKGSLLQSCIGDASRYAGQLANPPSNRPGIIHFAKDTERAQDINAACKVVNELLLDSAHILKLFYQAKKVLDEEYEKRLTEEAKRISAKENAPQIKVKIDVEENTTLTSKISIVQDNKLIPSSVAHRTNSQACQIFCVIMMLAVVAEIARQTFSGQQL